MENSFTSKMISKSDSDLLDYVNNYTQYQDNAVISAINELDKRGKADSEILEIKNQIIQKIDNQNQQIQQSKDEFKIPNDIPKTISNAAKLLYLTIGIGIVNSLLMEFTTDYQSYSDPKTLSILVISLGLMGFFAYMINIGRKWARNTFLVLFGLGFLMFPFTITHYFGLNPLIGLLSLTQTGLQIFALILLFKKETKDWYKKMNENTDKQEPTAANTQYSQ